MKDFINSHVQALWFIIIILPFLCLEVQAQETYSEWGFSKNLYFDTTSSGAGITSSVTNFPVLIRLDSTNYDFSQAGINGEDIRFTDPDDTPLYFEIERWDSTSEMAEFWVRVPRINGNSSSDFIVMYWGNPDVSDGQTGVNVWDSYYEMVQHLQESCAVSGCRRDSTSNSYNGTPYSGVSVTDLHSSQGTIDGADSFDGTDDYVSIGLPSVFNDVPNNDFTISFWTNVQDISGSGVVWTRFLEARYDDTNFVQFVIQMNDGELGINLIDAGTERTMMVDSSISAGVWYHVAGVWDASADDVRLYLNGVLQSGAGSTPADPGIQQILNIGRRSDGSAATYLNGFIDEVRVSNVARNADWIKLAYQNQKSPDALITYQETVLTILEREDVVIRNNVINPSMGETTFINFRLGATTKVNVTVYDLAGDQVKVLFNRNATPGVTEVIWDGKSRRGRNVVQGVYFIVIKLGNSRYVKKVLVVR